MHFRRLASAAAVLFLALPAAHADVRLPAVFSDNMVLQRDVPLTIWGWADPGEKVTVALLPQIAPQQMVPGTTLPAPTPPLKSGEAVAGDDGRWSVRLPATATGLVTPLALKVQGRSSIVLKDVLIGDVWLCSGQSNMYWPVKDSADAEKEIAAANFPQIRHFAVAKNVLDRPGDDVHAEWKVCSPATARSFSAVAYYFARRLHQELGVPIGLVHSSWSGSPIHPWLSPEALASDEELRKFAAGLETQVRPDYEKLRKEFEPKWAEWAKAAQDARAASQPVPPRPEISFREPGGRYPSGTFHGMIAPLTRYPIKGVIWYQGESDAGRAPLYAKLFPAMIRDWRRQWAQPDMPFFFVQLAAFMDRKDEPSESNWARLREAQTRTLALPRTGMACTIDIGDAKNIHPPNKQDVGLRLALNALRVAYGRDLVASGPMLKGVKLDGNKAALTFSDLGGGLVVKDGNKLKGFAVAGADKKFVWADAKIEGETVVVTSDAVKEIAAVRYAWADNPDCNLFNKAGLPAVPFRTDDW